MKKIALGLIVIAAIFTFQLNVKNTKSGSNIKLDQMVQKAEACIEIGGQNYQCCPQADLWCYVGGGYEIYPYFFSH